MTIEILDPDETAAAISGGSIRNERLNELTEALMPLVDTSHSVWVPGVMPEPLINMLRTKVARRGARLSVRKVIRNGTVGRVLTATKAT